MADMDWKEWENEHQQEIEEVAAHWRKVYKSWHTYCIKHTIRKIKPEDDFILQYRMYMMKYTVKKVIDVLTVEHYCRAPL
jgi:hypothetical protein